jgi:predicted Zn-dependent protease
MTATPSRTCGRYLLVTTQRTTRIRSALLLLLLALLAGCGINPVTGKQELQFVSEESELQIGAQHYAPSRQSQGGDLAAFPEVSKYVAEVGGRLAAVSDRPLPYEFVVLNSSVPNAWALPGGKIAVNRGLLTALDNEAELAAVLGHEIVHAAARHGAKAQERGVLLQAGVLAAQVGVMLGDSDPNVGNLLVLGAGVGAQLINTKYGRNAELESDLYGMRYMQRAGYDPAAAVTLQQKFVALASQDGARRASWLEGLFASHPPSQERVDRNRATLATAGAGGTLGADRYTAALAPLRAAKPAYDKADEAIAAAGRKDFARARSLAEEAARLLPREGRFQQILGDIALAQQQPKAALGHYDKALALDPNYFGGHLGAGLAAFRLGSPDRARQSLARSAELLPTAPALYHLGLLAQRAGNGAEAMRYFSAAAESNSDFGRRATFEVLREDLPRNPSRYLATAAQRDARGALVVVVQNRTSVALADVQVTPELIGAGGAVEQRGAALRIGRPLAAGEQVAIDAGVGAVSDDALARTRVRIDFARAVEP